MTALFPITHCRPMLMLARSPRTIHSDCTMVCMCTEKTRLFMIAYFTTGNTLTAHLPIENNVLAAAENARPTDLVPRSLKKYSHTLSVCHVSTSSS